MERRYFLINDQEEDMVVHLDKDKYWDILNEEQVEDMLIVGGRERGMRFETLVRREGGAMKIYEEEIGNILDDGNTGKPYFRCSGSMLF